MPRKVLITKDTLEEILAKYQGGGSSGGTVEAEPIVSIKMTNLDVRVMTSDEQKIGDFEFYLTKDRWDNFVSLASSQFQIDITYANFDSVFKSLDAQTQRFALGYLLMDYYTKEILPNAIISYISSMPYTTGAKVKTPLSLVLTSSSAQTNNIEIVSLTGFTDSTVNIYDIDKSVDIVTANTVITVEEIDGPAIGSSSGSSCSGAELDKVTIHVGPNFSGSGSVNFTFERTQFDDFLTVVNSGLAQQGMTITITRDNFNTVTNQLFNNTNIPNTQKLQVIGVMAMHQISSYYIDASDAYVSNNLLFSLSGIQFDGTNCDIFDDSDGSYARYGFVSIELL